MPFKSEKQRKYLWAKHPEVAKEFAKKEAVKRRLKRADNSRVSR